MRRVVITGMGIVSSIGNNTQEVLSSLHEAKSGITHAAKYKELGFRSQVQGAPTLNPAEVIDRRAMRFLAEDPARAKVVAECDFTCDEWIDVLMALTKCSREEALEFWFRHVDDEL